MNNTGQLSNFSNFSRIFKSLQIENVSIPELKLLKQQHSYLQKLRQQRTKIQELKIKYDQTYTQMASLIEQNRKYKNLTEDQGRTILELESQLQQQRSQKNNLQKLVSKQIDAEKDKNKIKMNQLMQEIDELKRIVKQKDVQIFALQEDYKQQFHSMKESYAIDKKKIMNQYENRLRAVENDRNQSQLMEIKNLVARQNKALKLQSEQIQQLNQRYNEVSAQNEQLQQQCEKFVSENRIYEQKMSEMSEQMTELKSRLQAYDQDNFSRTQLQEIRKKMSELTKGEIERIQFIVNEFQ